MGITGFVPAVSFNVAIEQHERDIIVVALIKLSRALNNKHIEDALAGKRKLIPKQLTMRGKTGWDDQIPISNQRGDGSVGWSKIIPEGTRGPSSTVVYYTCSHCKKVVPNSMKDFQKYDLDRKIVCYHCNRSSEVEGWSCPCERSWVRCPEHSLNDDCLPKPGLAHAVLPKVQKSAIGNQKQSGQEVVAPQTYEELLEADVKRARRSKARGVSSTITLGDASASGGLPTRLGPILSRRFGMGHD